MSWYFSNQPHRPLERDECYLLQKAQLHRPFGGELVLVRANWFSLICIRIIETSKHTKTRIGRCCVMNTY